MTMKTIRLAEVRKMYTYFYVTKFLSSRKLGWPSIKKKTYPHIIFNQASYLISLSKWMSLKLIPRGDWYVIYTALHSML